MSAVKVRTGIWTIRWRPLRVAAAWLIALGSVLTLVVLCPAVVVWSLGSGAARGLQDGSVEAWETLSDWPWRLMWKAMRGDDETPSR